MVEAYDDMSTRVSMPGFRPERVPLALYDASGTYLIRHPSPPRIFERVRGFREVYAADTLLAELRANTEANIAGVWTATVGAPTGDWVPRDLARELLREAFHAYQTQTWPGWTASEVDLFVYPVRSPTLLPLRRLETAALKRAVQAPDSLRELCWAQTFVRTRRDRFARMPAQAVAYERQTELREGLARYVAGEAAGRGPTLPSDGFPPEAVRARAYETGHALGLLLDRLAPGWKSTLEDDPADGLDGRLREAIAGMRSRGCGASPDELGRTRSVARADLRALAERDDAVRGAFGSAEGWRLVIDARAQPVFPERFDPVNVRSLGSAEVLHDRWLVVSNGALRMEALGHTTLTHGVGPHPMFDGIDRLTVTGLEPPEIEVSGDTIRIRGGGITLEGTGLTIEPDENGVRIELPRAPRSRRAG